MGHALLLVVDILSGCLFLFDRESSAHCLRSQFITLKYPSPETTMAQSVMFLCTHCVPTLCRRTQVYIGLHAATCVDLWLCPATYVYTVMSVYVRLRGVDTVRLPVSYVCLRAFLRAFIA
jgi:hypothetical protein